VGEGVTEEHAAQQIVCTNCHHMIADEFVHTTHANAELDCLTCHMQLGPEDIGAEGKIRTAHDFEVKAGVCIDCHAEAIHGGDQIVSLRTQVQEMEQIVPSGINAEVEGLRDQVDDLEKVATGRTWAGGFVGVLAGLTMGIAGFWLWRRRVQ
jgi:formate-dependent nitrite reductase cytochrome c552 subunit